MKLLQKSIVASLIIGGSLIADTSTDAQNLVNEAYSYCEKKGLDECIKSFNNKDKRFTKGALYVFVSDFAGVAVAHGGNAKLVGKDLSKVKSPSGIFPAVEFTRIAKEKGSGWVDYKWSHPVTKRIADKTTFIKRFQDKDLLIGSGYYK